MSRFLVGTLAAAVTGSLLPGPAARQGDTVPQMPGRPVYEHVCSRCHGPDGQSENAPSLVPFLWSYSQALDIVRHGSACGMPAFPESELSDEELRRIVDYLKAFN